MKINNIWSQGQLFAFSGLDGKTDYKNDFTGILSGDRIGIKFFTKIRRELAIVGFGAKELKFDCVLSDCICAQTDKGTLNVVFQERNLVVGNMPKDAVATVFAEGVVSVEKISDQVTVLGDGEEFTTLAVEGDRFSFAFGNTLQESVLLAEKGLGIGVETAVQNKLEYYARHTLDDEKYGRLYSKCVSVMKTQIYSPEGRFSGFWSTPDRLPHRALWLWDSVFHSIGHRHLHPKIAEQLVLSILDTQRENGMIPHMSSPYWSSEISQPPVIAWGALKVYEKTQNKQFLKKVFDGNKAFLEWCFSNRRVDGDALFAWNTGDDVKCRCDESGMDNSPRFDDYTLLKTVDFSCFMASEMRAMSKIAAELSEDFEVFDRRFEEIKNDINQKLWDEQDGIYYDVEADSGCFHKVASVASFLPLFAGVADAHRAKRLIEHLNNPDTFKAPFNIPCLAKNHPTFGTDMWRGPVWINYNYMIAEGLDNYGYTKPAKEIRQSTLEVINHWYNLTGTLFEFYDSNNVLPPSKLNRKGLPVEPYDFKIRYQSIRDYGWTVTLTFDLLNEFL